MIRVNTGSMWGENASSVREEYLREKQKAVESTIQPVMSAQMIANTQSFPVMVSQVTSMPAVPPQAPAFQYQNVSFPYQSTASTVYPMTTGPAAVPQSFQAMSSASSATEARVSPVVRPVVGPEVVQKQPVLKAAPVKAAPVPQVHSNEDQREIAQRRFGIYQCHGMLDMRYEMLCIRSNSMPQRENLISNSVAHYSRQEPSKDEAQGDVSFEADGDAVIIDMRAYLLQG